MLRDKISKLSQSPTARNLVQKSGAHKLANIYLGMFPKVCKTLMGTYYRISHLESLPLADEILDLNSKSAYAKVDMSEVETFADLGCNVGYFTMLLHNNSRHNIKGLMVDANPKMIEESDWHVNRNGLFRVYPLCGVAGSFCKEGPLEFNVYSSHICSAKNIPEHVDLPGKWNKITSKYFDIENTWQAKFGNMRCNLLKMDIEGSELPFLLTERTFISRCDRILIEWHKWAISLSSVKSAMEYHGINNCEVLEQKDNTGVAIFSRI